MEDIQYRISKITFYFMLTVAIFFDVIQVGLDFIPLLGWIASSMVALVAFLTYFLWFKMRGIGFMEKFGAKKLIAYAVIPLLECFISFIPGLTVMVIMTYSIVKTEDKLEEAGILTQKMREKISGLIENRV